MGIQWVLSPRAGQPTRRARAEGRASSKDGFIRSRGSPSNVSRQFAGPNELLRASLVAAGPTNSVVVDKQQMYYIAGKASITFPLVYQILIPALFAVEK